MRFFQLPNIDASPAWEFRNGDINQKTMGGSKYNLLQKKGRSH